MSSGAQQLWEACLGQIQLQVPRSSYDTWFKETTGVDLDGDCLTVAVPTLFAVEWLERRMYQLIQRTVTTTAGRPLHVRFAVTSPSQRGALPSPANQQKQAESPLPLDDEPAQPAEIASAHRRSGFNPRYTFGSFVVGKDNQLAHAAAISVAERPGGQYNPLFIYAGVGLGKTHLLHAIATHVAKNNLRPLYVTSEQFTNEFITSIRDRKTEDFRDKYRQPDVLLLDDVQFLAGKEQTQEGFFHTFNDLHNAGKQIVLACDRPPRAVASLEDRLRSRFEWGLITDIQQPQLETRVAILVSKAAAQGTVLPTNVAMAIALRANHSIRELEGCLNRVIALAQFLNTSVTPELVETALAGVTPPQPKPTLSPQEVLARVAQHYHLSTQTLCTRARDRKTTRPQRIAMYILREALNIRADEVADLMGHWHKKTIDNSLKQITAQLQGDASFQAEVQQLLGALSAPPR